MNHDPKGDHTQRYRRLAITYGAASDPGVEVRIASSEASLDELVPSAAARRAGDGVWDGTHIPVNCLIRDRKRLSLGDLESKVKDSPCVMIQITEFRCKGIALAVRASHAVADSISLLYFVNKWAETNRSMRNDNSMLHYSPTFEPQLLDEQAAGDIDAPVADAGLLKKALALPLHRYDTWTGRPGVSHNIPVEFDPSSVILGTPAPFSETDPRAEISCCVLHFTHQEIGRIWQATQLGMPGFVSRHDALCAHVWILINQARGLDTDPGQVHLDFTVGLRKRTRSLLPDNFLGSPLIIADVAMDSQDACNSIALVARKIRSTIDKFDEQSISAILHQRAFEDSPQRIFHSFTGFRHVIQTSWMKQGAYTVNFGFGAELRYAFAALSMLDGFLQTIESAPYDSREMLSAGSIDPGVDVAVRIEKKTMERLLVDPDLRKYRT